MANAVLLAQHNEVVALDNNAARVATINRGDPTSKVADVSGDINSRPDPVTPVRGRRASDMVPA
jgi:hypothetical protein